MPTGVALPPISVILPTFNGSRYIRSALDSLVASGAPQLECIVVDDGSTDDTLRIATSYSHLLTIRIATGPRAGNWVLATNLGVEMASSEFVTMLHQDDVWLPGRPAVLASLLERARDAALHLHGAVFLSSDGHQLGRWTPPLPGPSGLMPGRSFVERLLVQNFVCIAAPVFRREQYLALGGMDPELWYTADWDLWLRLASTGPVAYDARPLVGFRVHGQSQTATRSMDLDGFRHQLEAVFERHWRAWAPGAGTPAGAVARAARASIELNVALAAASHRSRPVPRPLVKRLAALGPSGARRLARDARLFQRVAPRIRTFRGDRRAARVRSGPCD